jgi:hypothetical protein
VVPLSNHLFFFFFYWTFHHRYHFQFICFVTPRLIFRHYEIHVIETFLQGYGRHWWPYLCQNHKPNHHRYHFQFWPVLILAIQVDFLYKLLCAVVCSLLDFRYIRRNLNSPHLPARLLLGCHYRSNHDLFFIYYGLEFVLYYNSSIIKSLVSLSVFLKVRSFSVERGVYFVVFSW